MYIPEKPAPITTASKSGVVLAMCFSNEFWITGEIDPHAYASAVRVRDAQAISAKQAANRNDREGRE
jgi:hypothetical protein